MICLEKIVSGQRLEGAWEKEAVVLNIITAFDLFVNRTLLVLQIQEHQTLNPKREDWDHPLALTRDLHCPNSLSVTGWELSQTTTKPRGHGISKKEGGMC